MRIKKTYLIRKSLYDICKERNDQGLQLGYDYKSNLFKKSISSFFYGEKKRENILNEMQTLYVFLIDSVKSIKKTFHIAIDKNSRKIN